MTDLDALTITKISVGPMDNNAYLLRCHATGAQLMIDAANEAPTLLSHCGATLDAVVTTHRHPDHWQALAEVVEATGARTYAGRIDAKAIPVPTDVLVDDGDTIRFGQVELHAIHIAGHTPGSIVLLYDDPHGHPHLFSGDCLFPGGVGNTWGDATAFAILMRDVTTKLFDRLPDDTWVYPGHGRDTTLGAERPSPPRMASPRLVTWAADRAWVRAHHSAPALLHRVDPRIGLTATDFDVIAAWLARHS